MQRQLLAERWNKFARDILEPHHVDHNTRQFTHVAYYVGCVSVLRLLREGVDPVELSQEALETTDRMIAMFRTLDDGPPATNL